MKGVLSVKNISKQYRHLLAVSNVSFSISEGEAVGLLGANGAGKSTLIKCILNLVHASQGDVDNSGCSPAYLPELPQLPVSLTALSLLRFKCQASGMPLEISEESLGSVSLPTNAYNRPISQCSKGMRQRIALAMTLCGDPKLVCLDEPMSGLDALGRAEILALLKKKKNRGAAFLMSSHIVSDMVQICDRVFIMAHGKICEEVTIQDHSLNEATKLENRLSYWTAKQ